MVMHRAAMLMVVQRNIEGKGIISPSSKASIGLMLSISRIVGWEITETSMNDNPKAFLNFILEPMKLPRLTIMSQVASESPMISSFPEKVESSLRRHIICRMMEFTPINITGRYDISAITAKGFFATNYHEMTRINVVKSDYAIHYEK